MPSKSSHHEGKTVHLILQRYRTCKILLDESEWRTVGYGGGGGETNPDSPRPHCGWLVYTSFANGATLESVQKAVLTLFQMPFGTWGQWEEKGGRPQSLASLMQQAYNENKEDGGNGNTAASPSRLSVVLCPQANLVSQVKRNGKSVQYHGQCEKTQSEQFFNYFGLYLQASLVEHQCQLREEVVPESLTNWKDIANLEQALEADTKSWLEMLKLVTVVSGSFGKRQGLEFFSDMGPFCHTVRV